MKGLINCTLIVFILVVANACRKSTVKPIAVNPHPQMRYLELRDSSIVFGKSAAFDLDNNGVNDIFFGTVLVGDPVEQKDKKQWTVFSSFYTNLPVNANEKIPMLSFGAAIPFNHFSGYNWYNASHILLSQKTISMNLPPYWEGDWRLSSHHYLPVQLIKQDGLYNGWIELSFDTAAEKLVLHKAGISRESNKDVKAGN